MSILNHIAIRVNDIEQSKLFYSKYLGLESSFEQNIKGKQFEKVSGIVGFDVVFSVMTDKETNVNLELVEFNNEFKDSPSGFNHIAFEVEDVDVLYGELIRDSISTISEPVTLTDENEKISGKRFFYFYDPSKNIIEVFNKKKGLYSG